MDSKMNSMAMIRKTDTLPGSWSGFVKHLDRIVFKPELPFYPELLTGAVAPVAIPAARPAKVGSLGKLLEGFKPPQE
jgi:hypothetical protein